MPTPKDKTVGQEKVDTKKHDEADVAAALQRKTQDGKGDGPVPESDFVSFATEGVEQEPTVRELANEVLQGKHGKTRLEALRKLSDEGHDADSVNTEVQFLIDRGRPSGLLPSNI